MTATIVSEKDVTTISVADAVDIAFTGKRIEKNIKVLRSMGLQVRPKKVKIRDKEEKITIGVVMAFSRSNALLIQLKEAGLRNHEAASILESRTDEMIIPQDRNESDHNYRERLILQKQKDQPVVFEADEFDTIVSACLLMKG